MLYGMTNIGGANNMGVLFQYNLATSTYTKKLDFTGAANGANPRGSLMQANDGMLYGMTVSGGTSNMGVLFQYNPATNIYTKKFDFAGVTNGKLPYGNLMQASDGMLYGMTQQGGANGWGVLFQYNPATNTYTKKLDFNGATNGSYPNSSLMQASDGMLYGMTDLGGISSSGVLFQYNLTTNTYTKKLDFNGTTNGEYPQGSLMQASDSMLYGMANEGGTSTNCMNGCGVLFQYNTTTSTYTKKLDFAGTTNGSNPYGSLMQASDGMLYGMTTEGGTSTNCSGGSGGCGVLFQYNPATNIYTKEFDFAGTTNGQYPWGSLMQASDGMLYGMTAGGGANSFGVLFKYGMAAGINQATNNNNEISIYPNPTSSSLQVIFSGNIQNTILLINDMLGNTAKQENINTLKTSIDVSDIANGMYIIEINSSTSQSKQKLIINK